MKTKLSILIYSLASGGAERVVSLLLNELKQKYDITLFLMNDTIFYDIPHDLELIYIENSDPQESGIRKLVKLPLLAWKYKKLNKSEISLSFMNRPNYINILAKLFGMRSKVIISERAMTSLQHSSGIQGKINQFLIKILYHYADKITANSLGNSRDIEENFGCKDVVTINNPLNIAQIDKLAQQGVQYLDRKFTFITIGRLDSGKNHALMIEAMREIDAKLYIIGDGELRENLELKIEHLKLKNKVILLGRQENPYKYIAQADCFLFTSNYEGFPNVLLEALACGLPIISTDCQSGPREILAPQSDIKLQLKDKIELAEYGILIPIKNLEKLKESMHLMMQDATLRKSYEEKAKKRAEDFAIEKIVKKYEEILCVE